MHGFRRDHREAHQPRSAEIHVALRSVRSRSRYPGDPVNDDLVERIARRYEGRWIQGYVRGKLRHDPIFPKAHELLRTSALPLLDVGCGIGLLGSYLRERGMEIPVRGFDLDPSKIERAHAVAARIYSGLSFEVRDAADATDFSGNVAILDVVHYLNPDQQ